VSIIDLIFPKSCFGCESGEAYFCKSCGKRASFADQICPVCSKKAIDGVTHIKCKRPQGLGGFYSVWKYEGVVRKSILGLKYKFATEVARDIARNLIIELSDRDLPFGDAVVVPIPLHKARKNWRGFNQVEWIGEMVAKNMGWGFENELLIKTEKTQTQKGLDKEGRRKNILGSFSINKLTPCIQDTKYKILVFDDVWTTGSTLKEAAKVLKRNGAGSVWGLTIAH
jgi:competence protein ComFC